MWCCPWSIPAGHTCLRAVISLRVSALARVREEAGPGKYSGSGGEEEVRLSSPATSSYSPTAASGACSNVEPLFVPVLPGILQDCRSLAQRNQGAACGFFSPFCCRNYRGTFWCQKTSPAIVPTNIKSPFYNS